MEHQTAGRCRTGGQPVLHTHSREETTTTCAPPSSRISTFRITSDNGRLELAAADLDVLISYSSESEPASSRYLADFWPFFDFAGVVIGGARALLPL